MIKAKTTIIVGSNTFHAGQTVTGLSPIDREWMKKAGYITETTNKKETVETPVELEKKTDEF